MIKTSELTPRQKKTAIIVAGIVLLYILFGFIGAPWIVRSVLETKVADAIDRQITVESVRVNPLTLSLKLRNLSVREPDGAPFVKSDEIYANLQASSLFKWALVLKSVRLVDPDIHLVRSGQSTFNFSDIGADKAPKKSPTEDSADSAGFPLAIYDTTISGGTLSLDDRVVDVSHRSEDFNVNVSDFSSRPADTGVYTLFDLAARINRASVSVEGNTRPFAPRREPHVEINIADLAAPHYLPYMPLPENLKIQSLVLETESEIEFRMQESGRPELVVAGVTTLHEARLADGSGEPFVNHQKTTLDLLPSRVLTGELRLAELDMSAPEVFLKRLSSGELYFPFLAAKAHDAAAARAAEDPTGEFEPVVTIDRINLKKGVLHFSDRSNSEAFAATITDLNLAVDNFGLNSDRTARYRLSLETEAQETAALSGTASLSPLQATGEWAVDDIQASRYLPYYQDLFAFKTVAGTFSLGGSYRFQQTEDTLRASLANVHFDAASLKVVEADDGNPLLSLKRLEINETTADLQRREITVGRLALADADLSILREKDGSLNLLKAFVPRPTAASGTAADAEGAAEPRGALEPAPMPHWVVNLKKVDVSGVTVAVEDRVPGAPFKIRLNDIALSANDLSNQPDATGQAELSLAWSKGGKIQVGGNVTVEPLALDMAVKVQKMDIRPLQPYLSEQAGLVVTEGLFGTAGRMELTRPADAAPSITYIGQAELNRFASVDRKKANDFLKWKALTLDNLEAGVNPTRLSIDQISLADFFARVIVDSDGSINLATLLAGPDGTPEPSGKADVRPAPEAANAGKPPIRIRQVLLSGGDVDFSDRFIKPTFRAKFHDLAGKVSGLESIAEKRADVELEGMWAKQSPVKITGQINPLIDEPYVDLNLNISDIELSPFSPYSGKYLGYVLEKGKLTFNVAYLMENRKLEGKNSIYINQLTLGDTVDSPEAVSLPIKLAVALLKDREGNIELDLPVSGDLDDPQFKIGKVILTVLKNLIVKLVTSPFAALGSLAGGGEELSYLEFDAGKEAIVKENADKLDKLAKILFERPGLKLDIQGTIEPEADREALRSRLLENRLKAQKLEEMMAAGKSAVPLEEIVLSEEERPVLLEAAFTASAIPPPVDDSGKPVELTPPIMESLLLENTEVTLDQYRQIANQRAFNAKNYLLETGQVERDRIFIVEPQKEAAEERQDGPAAGRVLFSLE
jgi:hypothetical protein